MKRTTHLTNWIALALCLVSSAVCTLSPASAADDRANFLGAQRLYARQSTFKAHARITGEGSQGVSYDVEARLPNTYHIVMQHGIEGIVRGSDFFMKAGNSWMRAPMAAPPIQLFPDQNTLAPTNVRQIAPDHFGFNAVGGGSCELWLSHRSHLPQTLECRSPRSQSHVDYFDWNMPVGFTVPQ
ncbi:MAG: hypothetical protein NVSMB31_02760 [Vulcanimicrobiaceae bacterium]